jgi:hypothetical protein
VNEPQLTSASAVSLPVALPEKKKTGEEEDRREKQGDLKNGVEEALQDRRPVM